MVPYWSCLLWYSSFCHIPSALELLESGIERVLSFGVAIHSQDSHCNICSGLLIFLAGIALPRLTRWPFYSPMHIINRSGLTAHSLAFNAVIWLFPFFSFCFLLFFNIAHTCCLSMHHTLGSFPRDK